MDKWLRQTFMMMLSIIYDLIPMMILLNFILKMIPSMEYIST